MSQSTGKLFICCIIFLQFFTAGYCQTISPDSQYIIISAGQQYATSERHQQKWGEHYRKEWNEPVRIKIAMLDTLGGGVTPYQAGGGRQSKTLRLRNANNREYVLRSIDKSFGKALPEIAQGTFVETIIDDQASIAHPYAALTIPSMAKAAGIFHTQPVIVYIPKQKRLGEYNDEYGDKLYLFEQRPDENWDEADNFGNSKKIIGTEKLLEKLLEDNEKKVDQAAYVRARLFDMMIGDWGRHEDQWRWAETQKNGRTIYQPIPRDRDQVYTMFDGSRTGFLLSVAGLDHLQSFDHTIKDVTIYNFPSRNLDRLMTNEMTQEQWMAIAKDLQQRISDHVITDAIKKMPPEVFPLSGQEIVDKIRSRRDQLHEYARSYYLFLAKAVDIPGSDKKELFDIEQKDDHVSLTIYKLKKDGGKEQQPIYSRTFLATETEEIRIYGMDSDDQFVVNGKSNNDISLRIIPGKGKDSIKDHSQKGRERIKVYDNEKTGFDLSSNSRLHLSRDTFLNNYQYKHFEYDDKGFVFKPGLTLGFGYHITKHGWRKTPFASEHRWVGYYGPNRGSFAFEYRYIANQLIGKWNLEAIARADFPFVANYYGIGNETAMNTDINRRYYRYRSTKFSGGFDLHRLFDSVHRVSVSGLFQTVKIRPDEDRFIMDDLSEIDPSVFEQNYYARAGVGYQFKKADHPIVPTKGIEFNLAAAYIQNIKQGNKNIADYSSSLSFYLPFLRNFSLAMRVGGETITGNPEFFQLATLSGKENLRGFRRQRYYGKSSFYNNNELRFILNTRNRLFNGKIGLLAFLDQGRVWQPGEESNTWHHGYGGGFFISPFNRILLNASYGISEDDRVLHLRIGFFF